MYCNQCSQQLPENAKFCNNCGSKTSYETICSKCGNIVEGKFCTECGEPIACVPEGIPRTVAHKESSAERQKVIDTNSYIAQQQIMLNTIDNQASSKNKWVAFALCLLVGYFGIHRFYVGKIGSGIVYLFTAGVFGIGWIVDLICILCNSFADKQGKYLKGNTN